jgi:threonylcarbamoyladenosine tRNA methylthiotransferase MtaB
MVGFPGETQEDFIASLEFAKKVGFEKVHVFPYSVRPGTPAAKMTEQIEKAEKEHRAAIMSKTCDEIRNSFLHSRIGKTLDVLIEEYHDGYAQGYTANYTPVKIACDNIHGFVKAEIIGVDGDFCLGKI